MIFVVSGEGPTDIGRCNNSGGRCSGADFVAGPMAHIVDRITEPITGYSLLNAGALEFISEGELARLSKELPMALSMGKKREYETAHFFKGARALARFAKNKADEADCLVGAVYFRDADGTRSTERGLCEAKWNSMESGFTAEAFGSGVPMIPKPKSEAWLLCAIKQHPYQNCAGLEDSLSGNDNSPNPAKAQFEECLEERNLRLHDVPEMVRAGTIDCRRIDMPSFERFRNRLEKITRIMLGLPQLEK